MRRFAILTCLVLLSLSCRLTAGFGSAEDEGRAQDNAASSSKAKKAPDWFVSDPDCYMTESSVRSEGSPWAFDSEGYTTELLSDGRVTCVLDIQVCGDTIFKQQVIEAGQDCPAYLHYSYAPPTQVCCDIWEEAKVTGSPCDPLQDADCDGISNEMDNYPLDYAQP